MGCMKCGECCKKLYFFDMLMISFHTETFMFSKKCKFLSSINTCIVYEGRAKVCINWKCGA